MLESQFDKPPYPSQLELAQDMYDGLVNEDKFLIFESPTGTGKSKASIIGCLSYLQDHQNKQLPKKIQIIEEGFEDLPDWFKVNSEPQKLQKQNIAQVPLKQQKAQSQDENIYDYSSDDEITKQLRKYVNRPEKSLQIVYASRTHSQIKQWIKELKDSKFEEMSVMSLSSRQQLCCNQNILNQSQQKLNYNCKKQKKQCLYYQGYLDWKEQNMDKFTNRIYDIEDLLKEGKSCSICPLLSLVKTVDIVCLPYQLIEPEKFQNQIIVIDEAHNFGNALLSNQSAEISLKDLNSIDKGLIEYRKKYHNRVKPKTLLYLHQLHNIVVEMLKVKEQKQYSLLNFMVQVGFQKLQIHKICKFIDNKEMRQRVGGFIDTYIKDSFISFELFCKFAVTLVRANQKDAILYLEQDKFKISQLTIHQQLDNLIYSAKSLILLGGTMQPLTEFDKINNIKFKTYPHIISKQNCQVYIYNTKLEYNMKTKQESQSQLNEQTYQILQQIIKNVPKGVVVFFQSYSVLNQFRQYFESYKYKLEGKEIFYDEKKLDILNKYSEKVQQGAILLSVVGGQLSEGINFSDDLARAVVLIGVPYPNNQSVEIKQQMKMKGNQYYEDLTMRSVNQCIGRLIRHKNDYGLIFLVDNRFQHLKHKLTSWLQDRVLIINQIDKLNFFDQFIK
ncbi:hypothetical protein pb186bvf_003019 [Paramecium bursaria]